MMNVHTNNIECAYALPTWYNYYGDKVAIKGVYYVAVRYKTIVNYKKFQLIPNFLLLCSTYHSQLQLVLCRLNVTIYIRIYNF